jgi:hypothetical protein
MLRSYACVLTQLSVSSALFFKTYITAPKLKCQPFYEKYKKQRTHIAKQLYKLEVSIARCHYALKGHDLAFAYISHNQC